MKHLFPFLLFLLSSFITSAQDKDYAEVYFIGYGGPKRIFMNDQLIAASDNYEIVKLKIYSKGRMRISYQMPYGKMDGVLLINKNQTYYYMGGNAENINGIIINNYSVDQTTFDTFKQHIEKKRNITYKVIEINEDITVPFGELTSDFATAKQGTCFLIDKSGYLLTNYHVISGAKTIQVKGVGNDFSTLYGVDVIAYDVDLDLALLKFKNPNLTFPDVPFKLSETTGLQGTKSFVLGYPLTSAMGEEIKVTEGIISAKSGYKGSISQYQFSAAVQPGNSGSPLFDENGNIIGVINSKLNGAEGAGYAIKSQYVATFLKLTERLDTNGNTTPVGTSSLVQKVAKLKEFIFIVKTE
jgi:hypothetical protein